VASRPTAKKMTNDDFRKLMMTPRSSGPATLGALGSGSATPTLHSLTPKDEKGKITPDSGDRGEKRKKKKSYYAKLKRQEDDKMAELAAKYRDRAKERRDGGVSDRPDDVSGSGAYRAVAPDVKGNFDAAERRRQMIQESKFLGGDMEHTHLVKGLDFALLQKVRSEIIHRENAGEDEEEVKNEPTENLDGENQAQNEEDKTKKNRKERRKDLKQAAPPPPKQPAKEPVKVEKDEDKVVCKTIIAKNIVRTVFKTDIPDRNELFFPGRMAYIVELEEDVAESSNVNDIPTTIIRSKADVAAGASSAASLSNSTNDIVINKLTQILSYLRAGNRNKKKKKDKYAAGVYDSNLDKLINNSIANSEKKSETAKPAAAADDLPIYDDVGDYVPNLKKNRDRDRDRDHHRRDRDRESRDHHRRDRDRDRERKSRFDDPDKGGSKYFDKDDHRENIENKGFSGEDKELLKKLMKREEEKSKKEEEVKMGKALRAPDHYAECYPGMTEMDDAIDDSDEEADYSKMDLGNKKGPIGRWDFDTAEEYADYMSKKEALPKAAFQYGVKMNEGRKTRGKVGAKNDKAKLDKEWNKISALIDKRKTSGGGGGGSLPKIPKFD